MASHMVLEGMVGRFVVLFLFCKVCVKGKPQTYLHKLFVSLPILFATLLPSGTDSQNLSFLFVFGFPGPKSSWIGNGQLILKHLIFNSFSLNHDHPQTHELNNGAGSHYETEAPLAAKRPLEQEEEEEANQQEAKRVREDGDGEQQQRGEDEDEVEHHGEQQQQQQQQQVVPSPQLPIHTGGD